MEQFFVVLYDPEPKTKSVIVPREWIFPRFKSYKFGDRKYLFHHSDRNVQLPGLAVMLTLFRPETKERDDGFLYPGLILKGFVNEQDAQAYRTVAAKLKKNLKALRSVDMPRECEAFFIDSTDSENASSEGDDALDTTDESTSKIEDENADVLVEGQANFEGLNLHSEDVLLQENEQCSEVVRSLGEELQEEQQLEGSTQEMQQKEAQVQLQVEESKQDKLEGPIGLQVTNEVRYMIEDDSVVQFEDKDYLVYRPIEEGSINVEVDYQASYYVLKNAYEQEKLSFSNQNMHHENAIQGLKEEICRLKNIIVTQTEKILNIEQQPVAQIVVPKAKSVASTSGISSTDARSATASIVSDNEPLPKRQKKTHHPIVLNEDTDGLQTDPEFIEEPLYLNRLTIPIVRRIHEAAGDSVVKDRWFVSEILKRIFDDEMQNETLAGTAVFNTETKKFDYNRKLDNKKLDFVYNLYCRRVTAVGLNLEDRKARRSRTVFNEYVRLMTDSEHQKRRRREKKEEKHED